MSDKKLIQNQVIKNMILNFLVFTFIFSTLGIFLYIQVENSIYQSSDEELLNSRNRRAILERLESNFENDRPDIPEDIREKNEPKQQRHNAEMINPRIIYIVRNSSGEKIKTSPDSDNYSEVTINMNDLNIIYMLRLNGEYSYRCINYKEEKDGELYYIQVLINVDAEESIMQNFKTTLIISLVLCVGIALGASFILSNITLKPIIESWRKQTEFVQNASHELRTPLTIIQAKQELLLEEPESKIIDKTEDISISLSETRRLSKLVKDLMVLARSDSNKTKLEKKDVNIDELIKHVTEPFSEMAKMQEKEIKLDLNYNKDINIDSNRIHELLVIILDNSIKYTEKGDTITIKTEDKDGKLNLSIADTGIGISDENIKHIFDRFYREDKARSRETGGSGLGLAIAKTIVTEHGGNIKASHNKPKGTIIEIKLKK
ncbi:MAG: sensor histidine kinase [Clostridia bacterium]|nr:sensor histidine kinase [Clostridia bacterium]